MTSAIDATKPVSGTPTTQSVRDNFATAKSEITALQATVPAAWTTGSVVFATSTTGLGQDNANLFFDNTNKRLGIGTTAPLASLHIGAFSPGGLGVGVDLIVGASSDSYYSVVIQRAGATNPQSVSFGVNQTLLYSEIQAARNGISANSLILNRQGGNVGIGTAAPGSLLTANGTCANVSGAWTTISAREMKQDIAPYTRGLDAIMALNPVQFRYAAGTPFAFEDEPSRELFGLIAEEVAPHVPEIVGSTRATVGEKENVEIDTLESGLLIFSMINAIKTLKAELDELRAQLAGS